MEWKTWFFVILFISVIFMIHDMDKKNPTIINNQIDTMQNEQENTIPTIDQDNQETSESNSGKTKIKLQTNLGDIIVELYDNSPITTSNFKSHVEKGTYNGVIFHRIIDNFMIQGGDPTGTGMGDPNIPSIEDEFIEGNINNRGTLSMANAGPNTGSSQFFINLVNNNFLDGKHPVFAEVVQGMDIVDKIAKVKVGANDRPLEDVVIIKVEIIN